MKKETDLVFPQEYRDLADEYVLYKRSLGLKFSIHDQDQYRRMLHYLYSKSPNHDIKDLTKNLVDGYLEQFKNNRPRTIHDRQSCIRQYSLFLKNRGHDVYVLPNIIIRCPKDFTPYIFSKEEINRIFIQADNYIPTKTPYINTEHIYPAVLRVLYSCGLRITETLRLKIEDVDLDNGIISIKNGKNNVSRMVPITDSLLNYLKLYDERVDRTGNEYFFPCKNGEFYSRQTINGRFKIFMKQAKIPILPSGRLPRIHDLRHTFAVHSLEQAINKGLDPYCSLPALSIYMGHKGIESTEYYLRLTKHYFINVLNFTQLQADKIFPEVE